ncbi:MAG: hypothetical protein WA916_08845 [Arcobacter sp.]|uniref:hypothetical protein n=1 Tax=Arcobacter sp. TaxID=1872629 RepID=UPI003C710C0C
MCKAIIIKSKPITKPYKLQELKRTNEEKDLEKENPMLVPNGVRLGTLKDLYIRRVNG